VINRLSNHQFEIDLQEVASLSADREQWRKLNGEEEDEDEDDDDDHQPPQNISFNMMFDGLSPKCFHKPTK